MLRAPRAARLCLPAPVQEHLPILIGGSGPKVTMRLVAEYADMNDFIGSADDLPAREARLVGHCEAVGRDERTVERTFGFGTVFVRESREEAFGVMADVLAHNGLEPDDRMVAKLSRPTCLAPLRDPEARRSILF